MDEKLTPAMKRDILKRTAAAVNDADKGNIIRDTLSHIIGIAQEFIVIMLSALIIDCISQSKPMKDMLMSAAAAVGIQAVLSIIQCLLGRRKASHQFRRSTYLHRNLWKKAMTMDFVNLENTQTRDMYAKADRQPDNINAGIAAVCNNIRTMAGGIFMIAGGMIMIIPYAFRSGGEGGFIMSAGGFAAVAAGVFALEIFKSAVISPMGIKGFEKVYNDTGVLAAGRAETFYNDHVLKNYRNGKEIRIYSQQELIGRELKKAQQTLSDGWFRGYRSAMLPGFVFQLVTMITRVMMYGFAVIRASGGMLTAGEVIAFVLCFEKISAGVAAVSEGMGMMQITPMFCKQYFDFLDIPDKKYMGSIPTEKRNDNEYEFEFHHVWFRYPNTEQYVLRDVCMKWRIGEKMALVGRNGSGKSTLVKLLCRLYDPTEGEITLNGIDIRKYNYDEYMSLFSVVFQDSRLFSFGMAQNVAVNTEYDADRVSECIERSGMSGRAASLPRGMDTCLYRDFDENGAEISGGEAQKLCLARAIYKGAPFIVLDEPTAALDPVSEHDIYTRFNSIVGTRTAIYISHRLSSCRFCDEITVLDNGSIAERGSHEELTAAGGVYARMWSAQAEYYKDTAAALFE